MEQKFEFVENGQVNLRRLRNANGKAIREERKALEDFKTLKRIQKEEGELFEAGLGGENARTRNV